MRLAGAIVTLVAGLIGLIMGIFAVLAIGSVSGEVQQAISDAATAQDVDLETLGAVAEGVITFFLYAGVALSLVILVIGGLMFNGRSMALGIVAIVIGGVALLMGGWPAGLGGIVGGILFLVGRNR